MKLKLSFATKTNSSYLGLLGDTKTIRGTTLIDPSLKKALSEILTSFEKKSFKQKIEIHQNSKSTLLICPLGTAPGLDRIEQFRLSARLIYLTAKERSTKQLTLSAEHLNPEEFQGALEGLYYSAYSFSKYKTEKKDKEPINITIVGNEKHNKPFKTIFQQVQILMSAVHLCRDLVNETGEKLNPVTYTKIAKELAQDNGLKIKIRTEKELKSEGFNGLLTVGKGSATPPRMVTISYKGGGSKATHLTLLGKGVTFDTGGISLKPGSDMWEMKCDMAGSATALSALIAISKLKLKINVTAILVLAENRPGYSAVLPGDIFTAKNGKTVMVENTDAEGRLVLSDGLAEAGAIGSTHLIDLATLTGSIVRALGHSLAGLFSNEDKFRELIQASGQTVSEKLWPMPLEHEYRSHLDDPVADMRNTGKPEGGAISAALFLEQFVPKKTKWAHIDIAGTAFISSNWKYFSPGATGWGVKTLVATAQNLASK